MSCRDEIVAVARAWAESGKHEFTPGEMVVRLARERTPYRAGTIRTHVVSVMCVNVPAGRGAAFADLERVAPGRYRLWDG